ncbi:hypothetical protein [Seonamhaeicola sp.]|uniref:hypothetical protein n=1 Tax=Seonamhaeicola sp. TaxID=1912245 RepID=UPI003566F644
MEQTLLGKVKDAKILKAKRDRRTRRLSGLNGLVIEFETEETITNKTVVQLIYNDKIKPFNVREVEVVGNKLLGRAVECGYWAHKLEHQENLDLRTLIDCGVRMVKDEETLKNIRQASLWT